MPAPRGKAQRRERPLRPQRDPDALVPMTLRMTAAQREALRGRCEALGLSFSGYITLILQLGRHPTAEDVGQLFVEVAA
ncbi:MAG: hypothetical protein KY451_12035 [Actinobacteria bacterium]|nr:hypothetical protein [Actinomycetota bacterium]